MIVRIILFTSLISLAISSMLTGEIVEIWLVDQYLNDWLIAAISYRVFIFCMLTISFLAVLGYRHLLVRIGLISVIGVIIVDSCLYLMDQEALFSLFLSPKYKLINWISLTLLLPSAILYCIREKVAKTNKWLVVTSIALALGLSLVRVVYIDDWIVVAKDQKQITLEEAVDLLKNKNVETNSEELLLSFFSLSCPYCHLTSIKLAISAKKSIIPETIIVFPGSEEDAKEFLSATNFENAKFITLPEKEFFTLAGVTTPSMFYITKNSCQQFVGAQFNNIVLHKIKP